MSLYFHDVPKNWHTANFDHRLWTSFRLFSQPRAETPGQYPYFHFNPPTQRYSTSNTDHIVWRFDRDKSIRACRESMRFLGHSSPLTRDIRKKIQQALSKRRHRSEFATLACCAAIRFTLMINQANSVLLEHADARHFKQRMCDPE